MFYKFVHVLFNLVESSDWLWVDKYLHFLDDRSQVSRPQEVVIQKLENTRTQFWVPGEHKVEEDAKVSALVLTFKSLLLNNTFK